MSVIRGQPVSASHEVVVERRRRPAVSGGMSIGADRSETYVSIDRASTVRAGHTPMGLDPSDTVLELAPAHLALDRDPGLAIEVVIAHGASRE